MGVRVLYDPKERYACLYCSTSMWAFGPVIYEGDNGDSAADRAQAFLDWLPKDARRYDDAELEKLFYGFLSKVESAH